VILAFILAAGTLATAAAVLLLVPLVRRRADQKPASLISAIVVMFAILLGGAGLYEAFSNYQWTGGPVADSPAAMTARLARKLAQSPDSPQNLNDWLLLGKSYAELDQFPLAVRAYSHADKLAQGKNFEALIGIGETLLAQDSEYIRSAAGTAFERALQIDPQSGKALFYGAFAALGRGDRPLARERFETMLAENPPDAVRKILEAQIAAIDGQQLVAAGDDAKVTVHVTLAPAMSSKVAAGASLFVLARDPQQPGPPFAVKRLPATFPVDVELSGADAMLASRRIAKGQSLQIVARVSLSGKPTATRGDPFGQVGYHVGQDGRLNIVIDELAP
jgi:cytochrome c-type biogenesis protein CcmH